MKHSGADVIPWVVRGRRAGDDGGHLVDLSGFHVAVLWAGSSIAAVGVSPVPGLRSCALPCRTLQMLLVPAHYPVLHVDDGERTTSECYVVSM